MTAVDRKATHKPPSGIDQILADLVEQFLQRIQAGESLDPSGFAAEHPEHAESLRQLLPALEMMAELGHSATRDRPGLPPSEDISGPGLGILGDFQILREVGRGGMGVVYEAEQRSLRRRVALKVLPFAAAMDPRHLQRFKAEAQAAAMLHHTNIVPVHAVGCERGVHYYAMQFIEGRTLADVILELRRLEGKEEREDEERAERGSPAHGLTASLLLEFRFQSESGPGEAGTPTTPLLESRLQSESGPGEAGTPTPPGRGSPDAALGRTDGLLASATSSSSTRNRAYFRNVARLGVEAAEALEHAHQEGIIHRDIKPANLMVDAKGNLWITDFGLARLQGDSGLTVSGDLLGTLRYMSPEQASGRRVLIDGRTDIYSLGVTLYELATLQPAFQSRDRQELLRRIADEEPQSPRNLNSSIPRELETVILKAMAKEPTGRYQTARELADDLKRILEDKPIRAQRPTVWERAVKWGRRHPSLVASSLVMLMLMVVMLSVTIVLVGWERKATRQALKLLVEQEKAARNNAEEARNQAVWAEENAEFVLQGITEPLKKLANPDLAKNPEFAEARRDVLDEAVLVYEEFLKRLASRTDKELMDVSILIHMALLHTIADDHPRAQASYAQAIDAAERWLRERPGDPLLEGLVGQTHAHLGMELWDVGNRAESRPHFRKAREAFRNSVAISSDEIFAINAAAWFLSFFQNPDYRDPDLALLLARRVVSLASDRDGNRLHLAAGLRSYFILGLAEYRVRDYDAARKALERSIKLRDGGDAYEWFVMAMVLARQDEIDRARELHAKAVRWMRRYRYSDFELHFLDEEATALLGPADLSKPIRTSEEESTKQSKP